MDILVGEAAELALGTAQWGSNYGIANTHGTPSRDEIQRMLTMAREGGVRVLDTARAYGSSEAVIGSLVGADRGWQVVTKLTPDLPASTRFDASIARAVEESVAESCSALRRDRLDVLLLHRARHRTDWGGEVWNLLRHLQSTGRLGELGVSAQTPEQALGALEEPSVQAIQVAASLFDQRLERIGFFASAAKLGRRIFVRSVLLQGAATLAPEELPPHLSFLKEALGALGRWGQERGLTVAAVCVRYAAAVTYGTLVVGAEVPPQVRENLEASMSPTLSAADIEELRSLVAGIDESRLDPAFWPARMLERGDMEIRSEADGAYASRSRDDGSPSARRV